MIGYAASNWSSRDWCFRSNSRSTLLLEIPSRRARSALRIPVAVNAR